MPYQTFPSEKEKQNYHLDIKEKEVNQNNNWPRFLIFIVGSLSLASLAIPILGLPLLLPIIAGFLVTGLLFRIWRKEKAVKNSKKDMVINRNYESRTCIHKISYLSKFLI